MLIISTQDLHHCPDGSEKVRSSLKGTYHSGHIRVIILQVMIFSEAY